MEVLDKNGFSIIRRYQDLSESSDANNVVSEPQSSSLPGFALLLIPYAIYAHCFLTSQKAIAGLTLKKVG